MACFANIEVRWDFSMHLTANLPRNLPVKRLRFDRIIVMSLWRPFFGAPRSVPSYACGRLCKIIIITRVVIYVSF